MKTPKFLIPLMIGLLSAGIYSCAADPAFTNITVEGMMISLPKDQALQFIAEHNLNAAPAEGLKALQQLVQQKQAESMANPAVTTKSGQRATSDAGTTKLDVEPVLSPSGEVVDVNAVFDYGGKTLTTSFNAKNGGVQFMGAFDSADKEKNAAYLVFIRVRAARE